MDSKIEYQDENAKLKLSLSNSKDLPSIDIYAKHANGLLERIEKGMHTVSKVAPPNLISMSFTNPSVRKADEIQAEYDIRLWEQKQIKIPEGKDGRSYGFIVERGISLETALQLMNTEYGGFLNLSSAHFYWGENPLGGLRERRDVSTYFTNEYFDEFWDIFEKCELIDEIRERGLEHFKQISSVTPESKSLLFLDIAKALVPVMAPNDADYIVFFDEPVAANGLFFTPTEFNAMSKEEIIKHYRQLTQKRDDYMRLPEYAEGEALINAFIQGITGLSDRQIDQRTTGSSQRLIVEQQEKLRNPRNKRL